MTESQMMDRIKELEEERDAYMVATEMGRDLISELLSCIESGRSVTKDVNSFFEKFDEIPPEWHLARRDARMKSEALEGFVKSQEMLGVTLLCESSILEEAAWYRRQFGDES